MSEPHATPRILLWLGERQAKRPWLFVLVAFLSLFPTAWATFGLKFKPDFSELLPDSKPSVIEMRRISARLPGASTLSVVAQTTDPDPRALEAFVDRLVPRLVALGPEWVGSVDYGVKDTRKFFDDHKLLFAKKADLQKLHDDIFERYDYEVSKSAGTLIDEDAPAPPPITVDSIKKRLGVKDDPAATPKEGEPDPYPHGYYERKDGRLITVLVRTPASGKRAVDAFKKKVAEVVAASNPTADDPSMVVRYTGDLITSAEEYDAIVRDLGEVGFWGVVGVLGSVLLFFLRVRTVFTMGAGLLVALFWTFGLTRFTIGYLNSSTGFLVSIIAGNGINYGIMYMARYVEARRDQGKDVAESIAIAHRDSWLPTLASAATAMLAYGSLMVTDFRGFKHFGVIGSYGMIFCWLSTYLFMPAILAASERVLPSYHEHAARDAPSRARGYYGVLFAKAATSFPRVIMGVGVLLGLVTVALTVRFVSTDPMEYDLTQIRNERKDKTAAGELSHEVDDIVGRLGQDGMAVMTDRIDQVPLLEAELLKKRDAAPRNMRPFDKVVTIFSLLPDDQDAKLPIINEMRDRILRARKRHFVSDKDWQDLQAYITDQPVTKIAIADLPEQVARAFTEKDGTRGNIVYIVPAEGFSVWDAKYLMRWADSFRATTLPTGEVIHGSGRAVIFADMIRSIGEDSPKAISVAAVGTILVILVAFRFKPASLGVFFPWLLGITSLVAFLYVKGIKLNFLNFVAVPITIGIGAEYAHNLMQRFRSEGDRHVYHVVAETGGAVVLCSMTTTIGYLALLLSINHGIVSFGLAAVAGEISCILAAVLFLPAFLAWWSARREAPREREEAAAKAPPA